MTLPGPPGGEGLVEFDHVHVVERQPGFGQCEVAVAGTGPMPMTFSSTPARPTTPCAPVASDRTGRPSPGGDDAHRRGIVLTAGVSSGHRRLRILLGANGFQLRQRLDGCVGTGCCRCRSPAAYHDQDDLLGEDPAALGGDRPWRLPQARPARFGRCRTGGAGSPPSPTRRTPGNSSACGDPSQVSPSCTVTPRLPRPSAYRWSRTRRCSCFLAPPASPSLSPRPPVYRRWITDCRPDPQRRSTCMPRR